MSIEQRKKSKFVPLLLFTYIVACFIQIVLFRTAAGVIQEALRQATVVANDRLAGKGGSSGGKSGGNKSGGGNKKGNPADVVELTSSIFDKEVSYRD